MMMSTYIRFSEITWAKEKPPCGGGELRGLLRCRKIVAAHTVTEEGRRDTLRVSRGLEERRNRQARCTCRLDAGLDGGPPRLIVRRLGAINLAAEHHMRDGHATTERHYRRGSLLRCGLSRLLLLCHMSPFSWEGDGTAPPPDTYYGIASAMCIPHTRYATLRTRVQCDGGQRHHCLCNDCLGNDCLGNQPPGAPDGGPEVIPGRRGLVREQHLLRMSRRWDTQASHQTPPGRLELRLQPSLPLAGAMTWRGLDWDRT
jgi:hypothetical protein